MSSNLTHAVGSRASPCNPARYPMRFPVPSVLGVLAFSFAAGLTPLAAQTSAPAPAPKHLDASLAFRFGTLGFGFEVGKLLLSHLSARVGANFFSLSRSADQSDISYDAHLKLHGVSALLDLSLARRGSFHVTGGIVTNPVTVSATGQPKGGRFDINGHSYHADSVGTLTGTGKYPGVGPYVGLGFGTAARKGGPLKFLFDLGVVIGKAKVSLTSTGAANNPQLAFDLTAQSDKTQKDVDKYAKVYPVVSFGLAYHF